jgi:hypothetical protein
VWFAIASPSPTDLAIAWELGKWLTNMGVLGFIARWAFTTHIGVRDLTKVYPELKNENVNILSRMDDAEDDIRELKRDVRGVDGKNGMRSDGKDFRARLEVLEQWARDMDAVGPGERRQDGEERRHSVRRLDDRRRE